MMKELKESDSAEPLKIQKLRNLNMKQKQSKAIAFGKPKSHFGAYCQNLTTSLKELGRLRMAENYQTTLNRFMGFVGGADLPFDKIDQKLMARFESYLLNSGLCRNTSSYYMRNLCAMYNRAVDEELCIDRRPFKRVYRGVDETKKRAISIDYLRSIKRLTNLSQYEDFARDMFMFSFYTRGMSFVDIAHLQKADLSNSIITYRRCKTNQLFNIKCEELTKSIIDKYYEQSKNSSYLFPILDNKINNEDIQRRYRSALRCVNSNLKKIACKIGLSQNLTMYVARHSWASVASSLDVRISTISQAMGHTSEKTTRIYLASVNTSNVDKANSKILNLL